ncbi:hypothetical protein DPMN_127742 [Dreissena polymorpha]|uniref:Endonuclease/exonuclease/phosphatase domain-containing protein n=1 Tax=Dreissena polymorpha TaxID=45954 RepID=A0A9D4JWS4_DREPO|nr:hypothetical protein DPMN_127742 [Dreissena polymorpha]
MWRHECSLKKNATRDLLFQKFIQDAGLTPTQKQSSRNAFFHHNGKSQIDYFLFDEHRLPDINKIETQEMKPTYCSDHVPMSLTLNTTEVKYKVKAKQNKVVCRANWSKCDKDAYKSEIAMACESQQKGSEVDNNSVTSKLKSLTDTLHIAAGKTYQVRKLKSLKRSGQSIWNKQIAHTWKEAKDLFKKW